MDKITHECDNFFASTELLVRARKWNFRTLPGHIFALEAPIVERLSLPFGISVLALACKSVSATQ